MPGKYTILNEMRVRLAALFALLSAALWAQSGGYTLSTLAGTGAAGFSGDGLAPSSSLLNGPCAVAIDSGGAIYIADSLNHRVRKISGGVITTVAGNGTQGIGGDGGSPLSAQLNTPCGLAVDTGGNLYIADSANHRVRKVAGNTITTVAGNGKPGFSGDSSSAAAAMLQYPVGLAVDTNGILYIADSANHRIRKVVGGIITTVAGTTAGFAGDGASASAAQLQLPTGVAVAHKGDLIIADTGNARIRKVSNGTISTVAGAVPGFQGDGGLGTAARLRDPRAVTTDAAGNVFVVDTANQRLRWLNASGRIDTIAGNGLAGPCGEGLRATSAQLNAPRSAVVGPDGSIYVGDYRNHRIVRLTPGQFPPLIAAPSFTAAGVVNAASYQGLAVAPGEVVTIFGTNLGPATIATAQLASPLFLDTQTGGTRVLFDGVPAPMVYALAGQVSAVAPYEIAGKTCTSIQVEFQGVKSERVALRAAAHVPGLFALNSAGFGAGAVWNQDSTLNTPANPAARGSIIVFYGTGEGQTSPAGVDGKLSLDTLPKPLVQPRIQFGRAVVPGDVQATGSAVYAGAAPTFVAGLMQFNVRVPANAPTGSAVPLFVYFNNTRSKTELTVAIH